MTANASSLLVIFVYFGIGVALRVSGIATRDHAQFLLRLVFFVTLPALAFLAITRQSLSIGSLLLPVAAIVVNLVCTIVALAYVRRSELSNEVAGSIVLGASVANVAFVIPFVEFGLGPAALAALVLYDVGNAVYVATGSNLVATRFGGGGVSSVVSSLASISRTPLLLAVIIAVVVSVADWPVPQVTETVLEPLARMTAPLVLIAMGALFTTSHLTGLPVRATVLIRMLGGCVVGVILVRLSGLNGSEAIAITAAAAAPIGFNAVTLASINNLDVDTSAAALFVSVLIGLFSTTAILVIGVTLLP